MELNYYYNFNFSSFNIIHAFQIRIYVPINNLNYSYNINNLI